MTDLSLPQVFLWKITVITGCLTKLLEGLNELMLYVKYSTRFHGSTRPLLLPEVSLVCDQEVRTIRES